jgi:hypothetical protein
MSFNKRILPELEKLIELRESIVDDREFLRSVIGKSDCLVGSTDSMNYVKEVELKINNK